MTVPLLAVRDLVIEFRTPQGLVRAVDGISFDIQPEETLGLVGESGCGKTVTGLSLLRLVPTPPGRVTATAMTLDGRDLQSLDDEAMRAVRGADISMIFQEPMTALNPVLTIGSQMTEVLCRHRVLDRAAAHAEAAAMLARVGIPAAARRLDDYPHQLSGGMRQRVMIAMALSCNPRLLVADEPTTAVDVTTQAQILAEILRLQGEFRMAVLLVTHDLGVVAETCRRAIVMYCGRIVEMGDTATLFTAPHHPYTRGLMDAVPRIRRQRLAQLPTIPGRVPDLARLPPGCHFADRCSRVQAHCRRVRPPLRDIGGVAVACHYPLNATGAAS